MTEDKKTLPSKKKKFDKTKDLEIVGEVIKKKVNRKLPAKILPQISFDAWWMRAQKRYGLGLDMKDVIYFHFRARGFLKSKKFDEGLKDFGIK